MKRDSGDMMKIAEKWSIEIAKNYGIPHLEPGMRDEKDPPPSKGSVMFCVLAAIREHGETVAKIRCPLCLERPPMVGAARRIAQRYWTHKVASADGISHHSYCHASDLWESMDGEVVYEEK
mgnify:CR=1 FL=1